MTIPQTYNNHPNPNPPKTPQNAEKWAEKWKKPHQKPLKQATKKPKPPQMGGNGRKWAESKFFPAIPPRNCYHPIPNPPPSHPETDTIPSRPFPHHPELAHPIIPSLSKEAPPPCRRYTSKPTAAPKS